MLIYGIGFFFDSAGGCNNLEHKKIESKLIRNKNSIEKNEQKYQSPNYM